ncbi:MAG: PD-(D/E)XK nuclease family protein [Cellulosilyticaceae bacterium]
MVEFVVGPARTGKTEKCYEAIQEALKEEDYKPLLMLVPEQFNLQVQLELATILHPGLLRVEVVSFKNLAEHILKEVGGKHEPLVDDLERIMILKKLLEEHKKELVYFKKGYNSEGFIDGMNRLITLFQQNNVGQDDLGTMMGAEEVGEVFKCKLQDMKAIQGWFDDYMNNRFITMEKTMERLAKSVKESSTLKGARLWIDGFYGFTMPQIHIIAEMMEAAEEVVITLPMDKLYTKEEYVLPNNPFADSIWNFQKLMVICEERNLKYKVDYRAGEETIEEAPLTYLKDHYLKSYAKPYPKEQEDVVVRSFGNKEEEIESLAKSIRQLVRDKGYRYHDIGVLVGDLSHYKTSIQSSFKEYDIPLFIDDKRSIHSNSLVAIMISVLDVLTSRWTYKSIMSFLRLGMIGLSREDVDRVDNYILEQGIQGKKKWCEPWEREVGWADLEELNGLRLQIVTLLTHFEERLQEIKDNKGLFTIKDITVVLYSFLEEIGAYETIQERVAYYHEQGQGALEQENTQIWGQVIDTLERLVAILGEEKVQLAIYKNILKTSFSYIKMGIIPPSKDQVIVGTVDRTRLPQLKAVFVLGVNEGVIPKIDDSMNLFSEMDKLSLGAVGQKGAKERFVHAIVNEPLYGAQFLVYSAFTRAKEKLMISTVQRDECGKSLRPSMVYYKLKKLFGTREAVDDLLEPIQGPVPTMSYIGSRLRHYLEAEETETIEPLWKDTLSWYMAHEGWREQIVHLSRDFAFTNQQHYLKEENAKLLYPSGLETSISRLETYRQCPCCYFIKYGIKASERKMFQWNAADLGTLFHGTLERYPKELERLGTTWVDATESQMDEGVRNAVNYSVQGTNHHLAQDGRMKYTVSKITKMTRRAIHALTYQLRQGVFQPYAYEVNFGYEGLPPIKIQLNDGREILLKGQIDRVDLFVKSEEEHYIKILDYKSGNKNFNLLEVYHCLQLQLLLYLDAYLRLNPHNKVAGMFYFHIDSNHIKYELGMEETSILDKQIKQYKLSGLAVDDVEIIDLMESGVGGEIIPAKIKKDGTLAATSSVASEGQFDILRNYMIQQIKHIGQEMLNGKISAKPYKLKEKDGCMYCRYKTICQFDTGCKDNEYERLEALRDKNIWEALQSTKQEGDN